MGRPGSAQITLLLSFDDKRGVSKRSDGGLHKGACEEIQEIDVYGLCFLFSLGSFFGHIR